MWHDCTYFESATFHVLDYGSSFILFNWSSVTVQLKKDDLIRKKNTNLEVQETTDTFYHCESVISTVTVAYFQTKKSI